MRFSVFSQLLIVLLSVTYLSVYAVAEMAETNEVEVAKVDEVATGEEVLAGDEVVAGEEAAKGEVVEPVSEDAAKAGKLKPKPRARRPRLGMRGGRQTWTEYVGLKGVDVVSMIKTERPDLRKVVMVHEGAMVTMDIRMDRVRVYVDPDGKVTRPPRVG